jgi:hypothetical protein
MSSPDSRRIVPEEPSFQSVATPYSSKDADDLGEKTASSESGVRAAASPGLCAVVVVHGMGQQLPFETLDGVVDGLRRVDAATQVHANLPPTQMKPQVRFARVGGTDLPRAELSIKAASTGITQRVHLYEGYWAPLTEGEVSLRDVTRFLWNAAVDGYMNAKFKGGFSRFMFNRIFKFPAPSSTRRHLLLAAAVLGALTLLNFATTVLFAAAVLRKSLGIGADLVSEGTIVVGAALGLAALSFGLMKATRKMAFFFVLLCAVIAAACALVAVFIVDWHAAEENASHPSWLASPWLTGAFWAILFLSSAEVRHLLVQYVGDVAVYVTPHELDRFYELRQKIKDTVRTVVQAVYSDKDSKGRWTYDRIAVVGHSLGSVAAYDALNAMINVDLIDRAATLNVVDRTCLLLTFGSPLDKTAFLFTGQGRRTGETREALAAAVQPLIQDYAYRTFPWVNVYSPADIISGSLDLYDTPESAKPPPSGAHRVENVRDKEATTPIAAHTEYWKTSVVFKELHRALTNDV